MRSRNGSRGVTLTELFLGATVISVMAALAIPGFRPALRTAAVRSAVFELTSGLQTARTSSIVEARRGVLCLSDALGNCLAGMDSSNAWSVYLDVDGVPRPIGGHTLPQGLRLHATRPRLDFWPDARAASPGTLTICDTHGVARPRAVIVSQTGRVRLGDATEEDCRS
jgi:type IV fimbrial biogenesis protein FimT